MGALGALGGLLLLAGALVALDRIAVQVLKPAPWPLPRRPEELPFPFEDVTIPSGAAGGLKGWILAPEAAAGGRAAVAVVHGWGANSGEMLKVAEPLAAEGHAVLVFDVRHHGRSPPARYLTVREFRDDAAAAARFLGERYPERPLVLVGHSLGGAAAVLVAAEGAAALDGVVHAAAPADVLEVLEIYFRSRGLPGKLAVRILRPFWERRAGVDFDRLQPWRRVAEVTAPVLVIGAAEDRHVPIEHAERMRRGDHVEVRIVEGAHHFDVLETAEFRAAVVEFVGRVGRVGAGR